MWELLLERLTAVLETLAPLGLFRPPLVFSPLLWLILVAPSQSLQVRVPQRPILSALSFCVICAVSSALGADLVLTSRCFQLTLPSEVPQLPALIMLPGLPQTPARTPQDTLMLLPPGAYVVLRYACTLPILFLFKKF